MNAAKARSNKYATINTDPSMTDQSGAKETDINLIVKRYGVYGTVPQGATALQWGDYSEVPTDLREQINLIRSIPRLKGELPAQLREMSIEDIQNLTLEQLSTILAPPAPTPAPTNGEPPK